MTSQVDRDIILKIIPSATDEPNLVSFPQGIPSNGRIHDELRLPFIIGEKGTGKRKKHIVVTEISGVQYKAIDFDEYSSSNDTCKYLIGVLNPGDMEMTIKQVDHIYVMKPQLFHSGIIPKNSTMTSYERKSSLTEEFGSKKKKRAMAAAQSNIILTENISGATAVESAMTEHYETFESNTTLLHAAEEALELNRQALLPKYNIEATTVEYAYPINDLLPKVIIEAVKEFFESKEISHNYIESLEQFIITTTTGFYSLMNIYHMQTSLKPSNISNVSLSSSSDKKSKKYRKALERLIPFIYMIQFYKLITSKSSHSVSKLDLTSSFHAPDKITAYLVDHFTMFRKQYGKPTYFATKENLDKLLMNIVVIGLHLTNFHLDLTMIAKDLKLPPQSLSNIARELGCGVSKQSTTTTAVGMMTENILMATLSVPLKFPARKMKRLSK